VGEFFGVQWGWELWWYNTHHHQAHHLNALQVRNITEIIIIKSHNSSTSSWEILGFWGFVLQKIDQSLQIELSWR
jgi:hypothetical protein